MRAACGLILLLAAPVAGADFTVRGYGKALVSRGRSVETGRAFVSDLNRVRLELEGRVPVAGGTVEARAVSDQETVFGSVLGTPEFAAGSSARGETFFDLRRTLADGADGFWRHVLYRGSVSVRHPRVVVTVGRQRVVWGSGKFWNPTDVVNPYDQFAFERDERPGADAALAEAALGETGSASALFALRRAGAGNAVIGRLAGNRLGTDLSILGGRNGRGHLVGADAARNVVDGVARVEAAVTIPETGRSTAQVVAGFDRALGGAWTLFAEARYNGLGSDPHRGRDLPLNGLSRWHSGAGVTYELHPLVKLEGHAIVNLSDGSGFFFPRVRWSVLTNLEAAAGWQVFTGGRDTELGRVENVVTVQAQQFF